MATKKKSVSAPSGASVRLDPSSRVIVGDMYTARTEADVEDGDTVEFVHPSGSRSRAAVYGRTLSGTFLVERPGPFRVGFRINGKNIGDETFEAAAG